MLLALRGVNTKNLCQEESFELDETDDLYWMEELDQQDERDWGRNVDSAFLTRIGSVLNCGGKGGKPGPCPVHSTLETSSLPSTKWDAAVKWQTQVDHEDWEAVRAYQGMRAEGINLALRSGKKIPKGSVSTDKALEKLRDSGHFSLKDTVVVRGTLATKTHSVGEEFTDKSWGSYSLDKDVAIRFAKTGGSGGNTEGVPTVFRVKADRGLLIGGKESEVVLEKGIKYRVTKSSKQGDINVVDLEIVHNAFNPGQQRDAEGRWIGGGTTFSSQADHHADALGWQNPPAWKQRKYGGVIVDDQNRFLLREPIDHFDGYHWTFAKGGLDHEAEKPTQAALREVAEETGVKGEILGYVPGEHKIPAQGDYKGSSNYYFLMKGKGTASATDEETASTKWASYEDAKKLISQTTNPHGRTRDLNVLEAAHQAHQEIQKRLTQNCGGKGGTMGPCPLPKQIGKMWMEESKNLHISGDYTIDAGSAGSYWKGSGKVGLYKDGEFVAEFRTVKQAKSRVEEDAQISGHKETVTKSKQQVLKEHKDLVSKYKNWHKNLSVEQKKALKMYNSNAYKDINSHLRGDRTDTWRKEHFGFEFKPPPMKSVISDLSDSLNTASVPHNLTVFRSMSLKDVSKMRLGKTFKERGFMSTTIDPSRLGFYGSQGGKEAVAILQIEVPKGSSAAYISGHINTTRERELLIQRGSSFKVTHIQEGATRIIKVKLIKQVVTNVFLDRISNVFCKTGPGGGVDPTCSPGKEGASAGRVMGRVASGSSKIGTKSNRDPGAPDLSQAKFIKDLPGNTKPKLYETPDGKQYVIKTGKSKDHIKNEAAADAIYRALGVPVPNSGLTTMNGKLVKYGEFIHGAQTLDEWQVGKSPSEVNAMRKQLSKHFVADAVIANWDVIGLTDDNILIKNGVAYRVDNGGALKYHATGGPKGAKLADHVGELQTMKNGFNPQTTPIFKNVTDEQIKTQALHVIANKSKILDQITDSDVKEKMAKRIESLSQVFKPTTTTSPVSEKSPSKGKLVSGKDVVDHIQGLGLKLTPVQKLKLELLNPSGVLGGVVNIPLAIKQHEQVIKDSFPGIHIKKVNATAHLGDVYKEAKANTFGHSYVKSVKVGGTIFPEKYYDDTPYIGDVKSHGATAIAKLSQQERSAIKQYTGSAYSSLNKKMRSCPPEFNCVEGSQKTLMVNLEKALSKAPLFAAPVNLGRRITLSGETLDTLIKTAKQLQETGGLYQMPSITSASINEHAWSGNVKFHIKARTGLYVNSISSNAGSEQEVIQSSRAKYKVTHVEHVLGKTNIHLEEVL